MVKKLYIETNRLILRPVTCSDADALFRYRSDSNVNKYLTFFPKTIDDVHEFIEDKVCAEFDVAGTWFQLVILRQDTKELIGDIGLHFLDEEKFQVEIGYTLDKKYQGKGFALEALRHVIGFLFNSLDKHRVIASIDPENKASVSLVERLGFRKEAHHKESVWHKGRWTDDLIYALLKKEWTM